MVDFDEARNAYNQVENSGQPNESSFGQKELAGAAAFAGFKAFEDHQRKEGGTSSHTLAKDILAGFASAEVDRLAETHDLDGVEPEEAKRVACKIGVDMYDEHYGGQPEYNPSSEASRQSIEQFGDRK